MIARSAVPHSLLSPRLFSLSFMPLFASIAGWRISLYQNKWGSAKILHLGVIAGNQRNSPAVSVKGPMAAIFVLASELNSTLVLSFSPQLRTFEPPSCLRQYIYMHSLLARTVSNTTLTSFGSVCQKPYSPWGKSSGPSND